MFVFEVFKINMIAWSIFIVLIVFYLFTLLTSLSVGVRRMHDVGKSGWFLLIPVYNLILTFNYL